MSDTPSADRIARNVLRIQRGVQQFTERNMWRILANRVLEEAIDATSLSDHTLEDLASMGHPYSRRFPKDSGPHEDALIHHQTELGGFVDAFETDIDTTSGSVRFRLRNTSPHWQYLKYGTKNMRPRPLHEYMRDKLVDVILPEFAEAQRRAFSKLVTSVTWP